MDADKSVELFKQRLSKARKPNRETREWLNEKGFPCGYRGRLEPSSRIKKLRERFAQYARDSEENKSPRGQTQEEE